MKKALFLADEYPRITAASEDSDWSKVVTRTMRELGYEVHVLCGMKGRGLEEDFVNLTRIDQNTGHRAWIRKLRSVKPELVSVNGIYIPMFVSSWLFPKSATILVSHGVPNSPGQTLVTKTDKIADTFWSFIVPRYTRIIAQTPYEYNTYKKRLRRLGMSERKISYLPFPVDVDFFSKRQNRDALKRKWKIGKKTFVVSQVAVHLWANKSQITTALAVKWLIDHGIKTKVILTGTDPKKGEPYKKKIIEILGKKNVIFTGGDVSQEKLREIYWIADAYASPSHEGQGLAPREALAARRPLFLRRIPTLVTGFGKFAQFHDEGDYMTLAKQLHECHLHKPTYNEKELSAELEQYRLEHYKKALKQVFLDALKEKGFR